MNNRPLRIPGLRHAAVVFVLFILAFCAYAEATNGINITKHNLSVTGPGEIKAISETRICIFCHTPHNATPQTPLWNRAINPVSYILYSSTTMSAVPSQPIGPSRLCLGCHDGTVALGAVLQPAGGILVSGQISADRPSYLGTVLSGDHPFSFSYDASVLNPYAGLSPTAPQDLTFYGPGNFIECSTCHDAHEDAFPSPDIRGFLTGKFLVADNRNSALCVKCHSNIDGWSFTSHQTSVSPVNNALPVPPKEWPTWPTVAEWGCEGCHRSHSAGGQQRLLNYEEEERNCYTCHSGTVASKNIAVQFQKFSRHPVEATVGVHDPTEPPAGITDRHVECVDCHNPHASNNRPAFAPEVSGRLEKVSGMTQDRAEVTPALYEYEVCFKCHADLTQLIPFIPRVVNNTNAQSEFSLLNPSYHPVVGMGKNPNVPSIPSVLEPTLLTTSIIYCTDCHGDDTGGSRGPHGSSYAPILRYQYETADGAPESFQSYALCYRCHNRTSILSDVSFQKKIEKTTATGGGHSGHLARGAPCSACHDPHGIDITLPEAVGTGDYTRLINFDTRIVSGSSLFRQTGVFSGSCTLVCHGRDHSNETYP